MDTTQIYNLIRHVRIKAMKRTKRESGILPGSTHPSNVATNVSENVPFINRQTRPQGQK